MATQIQYRRGTAAQNNTFTGALGEISVDTTNNTLRVHDGVTAGGAGTVVSIIASTGGSNITGNLLPSANLTYNLGSPTLRWKTGYFSANTIDIGGGQISLDPVNGFSFTIGNATSSMAANGAITANTLTAATVTYTSATTSTNATTGALVVAGGVGIGGALNVTGAITTAGTATLGALSAGGSTGTNGQYLQSTGGGLTWASLSSTSINNGTNNVRVDTAYVNVAIGGSNIAGINATSFIPATSNITALGSTTNWWQKLFSVAATAQYADLAEIYTSDQQYPAGTVLVFGGEREVMQSHSSHDTRIAGVVSTNPAYLMNGTETGIPVALQGRVPCRVLGPISQGDRVVSSHIPGVAQALDSIHYQPGCIIGKALQAIDSTDISIIEVVVGRL